MGLSYCERESLNEGGLVRIEVRRVATVPSLVYVVLLDFNKLLGSFQFSELDNFSGLVKFSQSEKFKKLRRSSESQRLSEFLPQDLNPLVGKVLDPTHDTVYLTLRGILDHETARCREDHEDNKFVHGIMERVLEEVLEKVSEIHISDLYKWIIGPLHRASSRPVISMFRDIVNGEGSAVMSFLRKCPKPKEYPIRPDIIKVLSKVIRDTSEVNFEEGDAEWRAFTSDNEVTERNTFSLLNEVLSATGVYDQGLSDNCWAACVAALVNYQLHIDYPTETPSVASIQHMIDYVGLVYPLHMGDNSYGNCRMANEKAALEYVRQFGVCLNEDYKFRNKRLMFGEIPKINTFPKMRISGWGALPQGISFPDMKRLLVRGPIIGSMLNSDLPSDRDDFRGLEKEGIFCGTHPDFEEIEKSELHCVLIIGWTTHDYVGPLYHIQNSWGSDWSNEGFAYVASDAIQPLYFATGAELVQLKDQTREMLNGGPTEFEMLEAVKHLFTESDSA